MRAPRAHQTDPDSITFRLAIVAVMFLSCGETRGRCADEAIPGANANHGAVVSLNTKPAEQAGPNSSRTGSLGSSQGSGLGSVLGSAAIVLVSSGLIFLIHELGHVLAAKAGRMKISQYYRGFHVAADPRSFAAKAVWQRMVEIAADRSAPRGSPRMRRTTARPSNVWTSCTDSVPKAFSPISSIRRYSGLAPAHLHDRVEATNKDIRAIHVVRGTISVCSHLWG